MKERLVEVFFFGGGGFGGGVRRKFPELTKHYRRILQIQRNVK